MLTVQMELQVYHKKVVNQQLMLSQKISIIQKNHIIGTWTGKFQLQIDLAIQFKIKKASEKSEAFFLVSSPWGNRTPLTRMKTWRPNR